MDDAIKPGEQTKAQRFWLLDNGFNLARDTTNTVWLYTFRIPMTPAIRALRCGLGKKSDTTDTACVGFFRGVWSVYYCGPCETKVLATADGFRGALAAALRIKRNGWKVAA